MIRAPTANTASDATLLTRHLDGLPPVFNLKFGPGLASLRLDTTVTVLPGPGVTVTVTVELRLNV